MNTPLSLAGYAQFRVDPERWHRRRLFLATVAALLLVAALAAYGRSYYLTSWAERPFSPHHAQLKPGGPLGIRLGMLGAAMFFLIYLYPIRKRVPWLARRGSARHWLDFHVVLGLTAPFVIALHSSFKFRGIAGIAFWIMVAVALSGIVGRYIYAQIPRSLSSAEVSLKELRTQQDELTQLLAGQRLFRPAELAPLFDVPTAGTIGEMGALRAVAKMFLLDLARPLRVARLRRRALGFGGALLSFGGLFATGDRDLERIVDTARLCSALTKRIAFLERSHKVFHLWHVVHRPFSYSFAVLALLHIGVVVLFGFF